MGNKPSHSSNVHPNDRYSTNITRKYKNNGKRRRTVLKKNKVQPTTVLVQPKPIFGRKRGLNIKV